jgi:site-specific recombinase XerD
MSVECRVVVTGPLVPYVDGFRGQLTRQGYQSTSMTDHLRLLAHVSRWLAGQGLTAGDLTPPRVEEFLEARRAQGYTRRLSPHALLPLLGYLRGLGIVPTAVPPRAATPMELLLQDYRRYLVTERGLAVSTVERYVRLARLVLSKRSEADRLDLECLTAADVTTLVVRECRRRRIGSAKDLVTGLRSLLQFLHLEGLTAHPLAPAMPAVARWGAGWLPRALGTDQVERLLASCDGHTPAGRRDRAILVVLARLGLRAGEVAALELDDIDWRRGEVVIRGKGDRRERLPLPVDVGEALVAYLRKGRPRVGCRRLFLRVCAPIGGLSAAAVGDVVRRSCKRAGLSAVGSHRLRHSAATGMLRAGGSLSEVGQVLRHASVATTAIYAKVDQAVLRSLTQPWPGGAA